MTEKALKDAKKKIWSIVVMDRATNRLVRIVKSGYNRKTAIEMKWWLNQDNKWYCVNDYGYYLSKREVFRIMKNAEKCRKRY